jgi:hypothetical protein
VIDCEVALLHHFFEVAITEGVAQIPADAEKDDLGLIVTPLEGIGFSHGQTSEQDSGSGQSTIIDTSHPFFATQSYFEKMKLACRRDTTQQEFADA